MSSARPKTARCLFPVGLTPRGHCHAGLPCQRFGLAGKPGHGFFICTFLRDLRDRQSTAAFNLRLRPYHVESTGSRPITEVKQRRAWLVLGWVTAWEYQVP